MTNTPNPPDTDPDSPHQPSPLFLIAPDIDNHTLLGIQQSIMLGEMAVNRVLDNLDPP